MDLAFRRERKTVRNAVGWPQDNRGILSIRIRPDFHGFPTKNILRDPRINLSAFFDFHGLGSSEKSD
jgi:hypothetical protein